MKAIAVYSMRKGVGKTTIAINIATLQAKEGNNVFLLDMDFLFPALHEYFDTKYSFIYRFSKHFPTTIKQSQ